LEFIDQNVAEAFLQLGPDRRRFSKKTQRERDLVAKIYVAVSAEEFLVCAVGPAQLELFRRSLGSGVGRVAIRIADGGALELPRQVLCPRPEPAGLPQVSLDREVL